MSDDPLTRMSVEDGFTIVEVMAAVVVLLIGVLGTLVLVVGGVTSTNSTKAREQGTNLSRDLVERAHETPYSTLSTTLAPATLRALLPTSDGATALSGSTFQVTRRSTVYTVTIFACAVDDPADGVGVGGVKNCAASSSGDHPGSPTPGSATAVNVLGISVSAVGTLLDTVCNAVGTNAAVITAITGAISKVAPLSVCTTAAGSPTTVAYDSSPDDMTRVRTDVSWTRGSGGSVSQTTLLPNPK